MDTVEISVGELRLRVLAANANDAPWYLQRKAFEEKQSLLYPLIRAEGFSNFIDIGANYGFISMLARRAAPAMRVLSIEADPQVAALIEGNFALNGLAPPEVVNAIAGAECRDSAPFSLNPSSSLDNRVSMPSWKQSSLPMRTVESILSERAVDGSCFFKIDTQGYERHVLSGMQGLLERRSDWLIKMEFAPHWLRSQGTDPLRAAALPGRPLPDRRVPRAHPLQDVRPGLAVRQAAGGHRAGGVPSARDLAGQGWPRLG